MISFRCTTRHSDCHLPLLCMLREQHLVLFDLQSSSETTKLHYLKVGPPVKDCSTWLHSATVSCGSEKYNYANVSLNLVFRSYHYHPLKSCALMSQSCCMRYSTILIFPEHTALCKQVTPLVFFAPIPPTCNRSWKGYWRRQK